MTKKQKSGDFRLQRAKYDRGVCQVARMICEWVDGPADEKVIIPRVGRRETQPMPNWKRYKHLAQLVTEMVLKWEVGPEK